MRWAYLRRPQNLAFTLVVVALLGFAARSLDLADRLAQASQLAGRNNLVLSNLDALTSVLWALLAGVVLLMVIGVVSYRIHASERLAADVEPRWT